MPACPYKRLNRRGFGGGFGRPRRGGDKDARGSRAFRRSRRLC